MTLPVVVLDACVLYPAPLRDLLLNLADQELYSPKWSEEIEKEWLRNLLSNRPDLKIERLSRTIELMNKAFPEAKVKGYEELIEVLNLPDENDRHVLASGIKSKSSRIVTFNLRDFPISNLKNYKIKAIHPDDFILELIEINAELVRKGLENQLKSLKNPPKTREELLETLSNCGLKRCIKMFE